MSATSSSADAAVSLDTGAPLAFEVITVGNSGIETSLISDASRLHVNRRVKASDDIPTVERDKESTQQAREDKLSEWMATGICGNNITSSALYVVALCSVPAGKYAPIALAGIATLLYLFRRIYEEVVTALPVNGGTYNLLLNTTTKSVASIAACLTMLSYVTTAVISATSAMRYIHTLCEGGDGCIAIGSTTDQSVIVTTLITLSFAAFLNIMGITESAGVALVIFSFHMLSMVILVVASLITAVSAMPTQGVAEALVSEVTGAALSGAASAADVASSYVLNFSLAATDLPTYAASCECINATATLLAENATRAAVEDAAADLVQVPMLVYNWLYTNPSMGIGGAIYFGYSSALLGISGFESSSNYVENQQPGVFPKTLRNMWVAVTFINPSVALLAQCLLPVDQIAGQAEEGALLSIMAQRAAGSWLKIWIVIDATLVLVGAVITAFVGFTGLSHRMTVDRCLPQLFLIVNDCRKTRHYIIGFFWALTSILVLYTWGNVEIMAGVYTVAFLSVMFSFTVGNMLLKLRRSTLPTPVHVEWSIVILASICVAAGLIGNVISRPRSLPSLLIFGAVFIFPVQLMLNRVKVLQIIREITVGRRNDDSELWKMYSPENEAMQTPRMNDALELPPAAATKYNGGGNSDAVAEKNNRGVLASTSASHESPLSKDESKSEPASSRRGSKDTGSRRASKDTGSRRASKDIGVPSDAPSRAKSLLKASLNDQTKLDLLFLDAVKNVRALLDSDRATLWLIDAHNKVLWSKVAEGIPHIRVPMDKGIVGWTCVNDKILNIPDAYKDDRFNPGVDKKTGYKTSTILCVPINVKVHDDSATNSTAMINKMVGIIQVINKNGPAGAHFTKHDEHTLEKFCNRIGPAVYRCQTSELTGVELWRTLRDLRNEMSSMRAEMRAVRLVAPREHLERLVEEAVRTAQILLNGDRTLLWVVDRDRGEMWASVGKQQVAPVRLNINDETLVGSVALKALRASGSNGNDSSSVLQSAVESTASSSGFDVMNVTDCYGNEKFSLLADRTTGYKSMSCLIAPVCSTDNELVAVIQILNKRKSQADMDAALESSTSPTKNTKLMSFVFQNFNEQDAMQLGAYCQQLGPAVQRILSLRDRAVDKRQEIPAATLRELTGQVASMKAQLYSSYEMLFLHGNKTACELLQADRATVWLVDEEQNELCSKVADGVPVIRIPKTKGIVGWVVANGKMLSVPDAYKDDRFNPAVDKSTGYKTGSILCCPVHDSTMSRVIGAIQVINKLVVTDERTGGKHFTEADEVIIDSLCQHLRLAIENCNRVEGIESPALRPSNTAISVVRPSATSAGSSPLAHGRDAGGDVSNHTSHMRLSTEALLRFELAHSDYGASRGRLSIAGGDTDSVGSGSTGVDSYLHMPGDDIVGANGMDSSRSMVSSNGSADENGGSGKSSAMAINMSAGGVEEEWAAPQRRCRCCCCWLPCCSCASNLVDRLHEWSAREILHLTKKPIVYFTKDDSPEELNTAIRYMLSNEQRRWIKFVRVYDTEGDLPATLPSVYKFLEYAYPEILIEYTAMVGIRFGPECIHALSYHMHVPTTFMFMGSFSDKFEFSFTELGGLRLITDNFVSAVVADDQNVSEIVTKKLDKRKSIFGIPQFVLGGQPGSPERKSRAGAGASAAGGRKSSGSDDDDDGMIHIDRKHSWSAGQGTLTRSEAQSVILELATAGVIKHKK